MDRRGSRAWHALRLLPARVGGVALAGLFGVTAVVRHTKPLHPVGAVTRASWQVTRPAGMGVPMLDVRRRRRVLVRLSRAASLTGVGPDVMGLAVRLPRGAANGSDADLLFATTGTGRWTRFLVVPRRRWGIGDYTTLLPLAWRGGTAVLRAQARSTTEYDLSVSTRERKARRSSSWRPVGRLVLDKVPTDDQPLRFRPVTSPPVGLAAPAWVKALRQPAYIAARRLSQP